MDFCNKYPDYRHQTQDNILNGIYYNHGYPGNRYQPSLYRLHSPISYNGIGPLLGQQLPTNQYQNYGRYNYPNLPSYLYNSNNFIDNNLSPRGISRYYNHFDTYNRLGEYSYQNNFRSCYNNTGQISQNIYSEYPYYMNPILTNRAHNPLTSNSLSNDYQQSHTRRELNSHKNIYLCEPNLNSGGSQGEWDNLSDDSVISREIPSINSLYTNYPQREYSHINQNNSGLLQYPSPVSTPFSMANDMSEGRLQTKDVHCQQITSGPKPNSTSFQCNTKTSKLRKHERDKERILTKQTKRQIDCATPNQYSTNDKCKTPPCQGLENRLENFEKNQIEDNKIENQTETNTRQTNQNLTKEINTKVNSNNTQSQILSVLNSHKNRVLEFDFIPSKKTRRKITADIEDDPPDIREEIKNITPLPGFQQAFGSTEIGRFSETFLNTPESLSDGIYESETDTFSPQPWDSRDSLDGPHINLTVGASLQPVKLDNNNQLDIPVNNNFLKEINCRDN